MNRSNILVIVTISALIGVIGFNTLLAQPFDKRLAQVTGINSVFPLQNALHTPNDVIISVQFNSPIDLSTLNDSTFIVMGELSGMHFGTIRTSLDSMYAEFAPDEPFFTGELVTVTLTRGIRESSGTAFNGFIWNFLVAVTNRTNARFAEPDTIPLGEVVRSAIMGDYNGDGFVDIAIQGAAHQFFVIMLNDGFGNFNLNELLEISPDPFDWISMLGNGDLDLDGDIDFVSGNFSNNTSVILWNDGFGFIEDTTIVNNFYNRGKLLDVNADGYLDMVGAGSDGKTFTVRINSGEGQFNDTLIADIEHRRSLHTVSDFDNDGDIDVAINNENVVVTVGLNDGDGNFQKGFVDSSYGICRDPDCLVALDFNDDGLVDIASAPNQVNLVIFINLDSTFILDSAFKLRGDGTGRVIGKDLDGDGDVDLITTGIRAIGAMPSKSETNVQIWLNDGNGNFSLDHTYLWEDFVPRGNTISLADIENDGDMDLLIFSDWEMWILRNETIISVEDEITENLPTGFSLSQNFPNPFNSSTTIGYSVPEVSFVTIQIYNIQGQLVESAFSGFKAPGNYKTTWAGKDNYARELTSGIYFYVIRAGDFKETRKMLLIR